MRDVRLAERGQRADHDPLSRTRSPSRHGTVRVGNIRSLPRSPRRAPTGTRLRPRRGQPRRGCGDGASAVSTHPSARAHRGSHIRDRVPRSRRRDLLVHVRLSAESRKREDVRECGCPAGVSQAGSCAFRACQAGSCARRGIRWKMLHGGLRGCGESVYGNPR